MTQNLIPSKYFDLWLSKDTKNSLLCVILLPLRAFKCRRSKIKFFMPKKVKISNFEQYKCYIPQRKAENMYKKDLARKSKISCKKFDFFRFFNFFPKARGPQKFLTFNFRKFSKTNCKNGSMGTSQVWKGTKSENFVSLALKAWQ